jgi:hypothetical protein
MRVFADEGVKLVALSTIPAVAVRPALTTTLLGAAADLSDYAVVGQTDFVQAGSETNDEKSYSDTGKVTNPTLKNANGKGVFYRDRDVDGALSEDDPIQHFDDRQVVLIVKRKGVPEATAWTVGQDYEYFLFQADYIATIEDANGSYEKAEVGFLFKGDHGFGVVTAP